jgi:hypothetical protein
MKWLNSLGDLLYEIMSWLIFYPITLWRTIVSPVRMMNYADFELSDAETEQFTDTLNPPLFLVLSLLLTQAAGDMLASGSNPIIAQKTGLAALVTDDTTLLVLRLVFFGMFPLTMAARYLMAKRVKFTRDALKSPFYAQCYACGPFALFLGLSVSIAGCPFPFAASIGALIGAAALILYLVSETLWFAHRLQQSLFGAFANVVRAFIEGVVAAFILAILFVR